MVGRWGISLLRKHIPELQSEPVRIRFHSTGELLTALAPGRERDVPAHRQSPGPGSFPPVDRDAAVYPHCHPGLYRPEEAVGPGVDVFSFCPSHL